jgi:hypothetical protein
MIQARFARAAPEPEPVEAHEVTHRLALAVHEAVDQPDAGLSGPRHDAKRVVERALLTVGPAVEAGALQHHFHRARLFDRELRALPLAGLVDALIGPQDQVGALQGRRVQEWSGPVHGELNDAGIDRRPPAS